MLGWEYDEKTIGLSFPPKAGGGQRFKVTPSNLQFTDSQGHGSIMMNRSAFPAAGWRVLNLLAAMAFSLGCETAKQQQVRSQQPFVSPAAIAPPAAPADLQVGVQLVAHEQLTESAKTLINAQASGSEELLVVPTGQQIETLAELEAWALNRNPSLRRMQLEASAEWARVGFVAKLPDPSIGTTVFTPPMHFEPDRQLASVEFMQMVPWLGRLKAEEQRAQMEAFVSENLYQAERLRVVGDVRAAWYKLYILNKQIEVTEADKVQLESLIQTANARVRTGDAQPGDVLLATLEFSSLQEQLLSSRQQIAATSAELNRLIGRDVAAQIAPPQRIEAELPKWNHDQLRQVALRSQPELNAARLRTAATRWGIEIARLKRRPDLTLGVGCMIMDAPDATMPGAGTDSWTLGVSTTIPIGRSKYDAISSEASRRHGAAHASEDEVELRLEALLHDLWEQALASQQTVELYQTTILPQARQTFEADQQSLINNTVTFDRVIRDYRTLLNLELGYHRAIGQLATTLARIRQTIGMDLPASPEPENAKNPSTGHSRYLSAQYK